MIIWIHMDMNSYTWIHINYEFIWFLHIWIHMFHKVIHEFGCIKVPDVLESAWPFASLNLPGQYLPLNTGSLPTVRRQSCDSTPAVWAAESQPGPLCHSTCTGRTYHSILADHLTELLRCCNRAAAFWQACKASQNQLGIQVGRSCFGSSNSSLLQVDANHFEFKSAVTFSKLK